MRLCDGLFQTLHDQIQTWGSHIKKIFIQIYIFAYKNASEIEPGVIKYYLKYSVWIHKN
jgi:hypothetical protein